MRCEAFAPLAFGLAVVLQVGVSCIVFFGFRGKRPEQMTDLGKLFCCPEHEIPMFVLLCAVTVLAVPIFRIFLHSRWFTARFTPDSESRRSVLMYFCALAFASFIFYVPMLIVVKSNTFILQYGHLKGFLNSLAPTVLLLVFGWFGAKAIARKRPNSYVCLFSATAPFLLIATVYCPNWHVLSGIGLTTDWVLFHINYFLIHPFLALSSLESGDAFYAQYGVGYPLAFARLFPAEHLTYARVIGFFVIMATIYVLFLYRFLRRAGAVPAIALFAILLWLLANTSFLAWNYPQRQPVRYFFDVLVLNLVFLHLTSGKSRWLYAAYSLTGVAMFFITDIGLFLLSLLVSLTALKSLACWRQGEPFAKQLTTIPLGLLCLVASSALCLLCFSPYYPPDLALLKSCVGGILDSAGGTGYGSSAMLLTPAAGIFCFLGFVFLYTAIISEGLRQIWQGRFTWRIVLRMLLAIYGLELMLYFVSQSLFTTTLLHFSHPAFILLALQVSWSFRWLARGVSRSRRLAFRACREAVFIVMSLAAIAALGFFPEYQGMIVPKHLRSEVFAGTAAPRRIQAFAHTRFEEDMSVLGKTCDIAAWYSSVANKRICAVTPLDTTLYMVIGQEPWHVYPYYYYCMKVKDRANMLEAIRGRRPEIVLLQTRNFPREEDTPYVATGESIELFRQLIVSEGYVVERTAGPFEFWAITQE